MDRTPKTLNAGFIVQQIEELWHNIYRMHGYLEVELGKLNGERPGVLQNADGLLRACYARVASVLNDDHLTYLEKPAGFKPPGVSDKPG
jgi:hypothetical protein